MKIIDLTHTVSSKSPTWDGGCGFQKSLELDYDDCMTNVKFRTQKFMMKAGIGTHMDAPAHCIKDAKTIDQLEVQNFVAPCVKIDVSDRVHENYIISIQDITVDIPPQSFVLFYTGWDHFWNDPQKYRNDLKFPCIAKEVAEFLLTKNIVGIGIDTLSPDCDDTFPVHQCFLGAGKYIIENVANASLLPVFGSTIVALPMKIQDATEAPIRLVAIMEEE